MRAFLLPIVWGLVCLPAASARAETLVPMHDSGRSTFTVTGRIDGFGELPFLVDTGAAFTTVTQDAVDMLLDAGRAKFLKSMEAVYADGSVQDIHIYRIDALTIGTRCALQDIEVAVIPGAKGDRCLLGLSALKRAAPFRVEFDPPALALNGCIDSGLVAQRPAVTPRQ